MKYTWEKLGNTIQEYDQQDKYRMRVSEKLWKEIHDFCVKNMLYEDFGASTLDIVELLERRWINNRLAKLEDRREEENKKPIVMKPVTKPIQNVWERISDLQWKQWFSKKDNPKA